MGTIVTTRIGWYGLLVALLPFCGRAQSPVWQEQSSIAAVWHGGGGAPVWHHTRSMALAHPADAVLLNEDALPVNLAEIKAAIPYPQMARDAGITGTVVLWVRIDEQGRYVSHAVNKSPHPWLTQAVVSKIAKVRFTPALAYGNPVASEVLLPFTFTLNPLTRMQRAGY